GETKKQFEKSAEVMKKVQYDMVFFGQYSPRPGTAAWKLKDSVSKPEKARRENILNEILKKTAFENNQKYLGKTLEILIDKKKGEGYFGRTRTGKNVKIVSNLKNLVGNFVEAEITGASAWNLEARIPKEKVIVILGPTSSGKSDIAIKLAQKFNGEIISADSRQIYRHLDIGSGKITKTEQKMAPHHMLDIVSPKTRWSAGQFKKKAEKIITDILKRKKVPIICGGTGFWIKALVDNVAYPEVKPDWKLREKLAKKSAGELFQELKRIDPERAEKIDSKNKVRLIRAIEICQTLGKVPTLPAPSPLEGEGWGEVRSYDFLQIGISWPKDELHKRIEERLKKRFRAGMIEEVENLRKDHRLSWKRIEEFGLGYFWIAKYFQEEVHPVKYATKRRPLKAEFNRVTKDEIFEKVFQAEKDYAKRQMTWFSKDKRIIWLSKYSAIEKEVGKFLL
ncbi:MAG: tRNA (adenosine(37)-N6)-dimethylallyltransferase MiaA, partial [Patescibacteria group bacterium]